MNRPQPDYAADPDTRSMMEFAAGGDEAFDRIIENFQRQVYGTIYRYVGDRHLAEDCAQEVFLRLYRMRKSYRPTARLSTLIYRITTNLCLNFIRDGKRRRTVSLDEPRGQADTAMKAGLAAKDAGEVSARLEAEERARIVRAALEKIPPRQRIAILLHRFEGLSYAEVAGVMDISIAAVKSLLSRARSSLAEALKGDIEAGNL